jgi:hypothetical protein
MEYIVILMIWTVVGVGDAKGSPTVIKMDWRPLGEFHMEQDRYGPGKKTARQMCEEAARQLALKSENYRCVRSK